MLCILLAALGADAVIHVVVFEVRKAVAGVRQLIGKGAVFRAAAERSAVGARLAHEPELVHVRAVVLAARNELCAFLRAVRARVDGGAGRGHGERRRDHRRRAKHAREHPLHGKILHSFLLFFSIGGACRLFLIR